MARVSIYVSDEQKAEMDKLESEANWSSVAQAAFDREIERLKWPKETNMDKVIARLKQSKGDYVEAQKKFGVKDGRHWAMNTASYSELKTLAEIDTSTWHG